MSTANEQAKENNIVKAIRRFTKDPPSQDESTHVDDQPKGKFTLMTNLVTDPPKIETKPTFNFAIDQKKAESSAKKEVTESLMKSELVKRESLTAQK